MIGKSWKIDPLAYFRLRRYIRDLKPDIVHTWIFAANAYGRQAALGAGTARRGDEMVDDEAALEIAPWLSGSRTNAEALREMTEAAEVSRKAAEELAASAMELTSIVGRFTY